MEELRVMAQEKEKSLRNAGHKIMGSMFIRTISLPNGGIIIQGWTSPNLMSVSTLYLYVAIKDGSGLQMYHMKVGLSMDREKIVLERYTQIGSSLLAIAPGEIPTQAGYCLDETILLDTPLPRDEYGRIGIFLPDAKYLIIGMHMFTVQAKPNPLHAGELRKECAQLGGEGCFALRNGPHPVGPLPGYEICVAGVEPEARFRIFGYTWYTPGEVKNNNLPAINFQMGYVRVPFDGRNGPRPFFTDEESLEMWDRMVNSIRFRPIS
jgi:hypothetical protein